MKASLSTDNALERFPVQSIRGNFPALNLDENFVFFDNAAGAQVPQAVLDAVKRGALFEKPCSRCRDCARKGECRDIVEYA